MDFTGEAFSQNIFRKSAEILHFLLENHVNTWYNNYRKEVRNLKDFIRELTEVVRELNKLMDQLIRLAWKISSLAGVILFLIYSLTK